MRYRNEKGFTLVELLAVIVILGLLMTVGVISVTEYIVESRYRAYISTAQEYMTIASNQLAKQELVARDINTVYYIHINNLMTEEDNDSSPFGRWVDAYVVVTIDPDTSNFEYYWTSVDEEGYRVDLVSQNDLTISDIYISNDKTISPSYPIGGRDNIVVYDAEKNKTSDVPSVELTTAEAEKCYEYVIHEEGIEITNYKKECGTDVTIPSYIDDVVVFKIGEGAFKNKGLTNVTIYKGVTSIAYSAFQDNKIDTVKLSMTVKTVGDYAFYRAGIKNLVMSEGIQKIGTYAFASNNICSVNLPSSLTSIGSYAFSSNCLTKISLPAGVSVQAGTFSNNDVDDANAYIYAKDAEGNPNYSTIVGYAGNNVNNIVIPSEKYGVKLKKIENNAFSGLGITGHVKIPSTVTYIGGDAFAFNSISSVELPEGLLTISSGAFRSNNLTSIDIPDSVTSLGSYPFNTNKITGEEGLIYARTSSGIDYSTIVGYAGGKSSGTITIPAKKNNVVLTSIKGSAFADCNLTAIYLPSLSEVPNLTIANNAFARNRVASTFTSEYGNGGFFYKVTNGKIDYTILSSYAGPTDGVSGTITIPEAMNGESLLTIQASFTWMSYKKIVVPSTVTSISSGIFGKSARNNPNFVTIVNKTGKSFNWKDITSSSYAATFVTGTIKHSAGNIEVVSE